MAINVGDLQGSLSLEDQLSNALDKIHDRLTLAGVDFDTLNNKIVQSADVMKTAASAQVNLQSEFAKSQVTTASLRTVMHDLAEAMLENPAAAKQLQGEMNKASEEFLRSKAAGDALKASMKDLDLQFNTLADTSKITTQQVVAFGRGAQELGVVLSAAVTAPIVALTYAVADLTLEFDKAETKVVALAGVSRQEVEGLRGSVLQLATDVGIMPAELEKGLFVIESAGFRGGKAMEILDVSARMAAVGLGQEEDTARGVVAAMLNYSKEHLTAAQAGDIFTRTVQLGNMKVDELVNALGRVGPIAAEMGVRFADVNAAIATFTHLGVSTSIAATGVTAALTAILRDGVKTEKGLKGLHITMQELRDEVANKGLPEALLHLANAASQVPGGMDNLEKVFPNIRALTLVLADAVAQGENFADITQKIRGANGTLADSMEETKKTVTQQWNEMKASFQVLAITVGEDLLPTLRSLVKFFKEDIFPVIKYGSEIFTNLPVPVQNFALVLAGIAAVAGPSLIFVGELVRSYGHLSALLKDTAFIETAVGAFKGLTAAIEASQAASMLLTTTGIFAGLAVAGLAGYEVIQALSEAWKLYTERQEQAASAGRQQEYDQKTINEAMRVAQGPVRDLDEAMEILRNHSADLRREHEFVGPILTETATATTKLTEAQKLAAAYADIQKMSVSQLSDEVIGLTLAYFENGASSAEALKKLKEHELATDDDKIAVENLHDIFMQHAKDSKEIAAAKDEAYYATVALTDAQITEADQLLKLGIGHQVIAREIGAHLSQVQALVSANKEAAAAAKIEEEGAMLAEKTWTKYYENKNDLRLTDHEKAVAAAERTYELAVEEAQKKGIIDEGYYNGLWALREQDVQKNDSFNKEIYKNSRQFLVDELRDAKQHLYEARTSGLTLSETFEKGLVKAVDTAQKKLDEFGKMSSGMLMEVAGKVHMLSGEWVDLTEAMKRFNAGNTVEYDLKSQAGIEEYRRANPGMNVQWSDDQIAAFVKNGGSLQDLIRMGIVTPRNQQGFGGNNLPGFAEGGIGNFGAGTLAMLHGKEAIVPLPNAMGHTIEKGAIQINYPIMNDRKSLDNVGRMLDKALVNLMRNKGSQI
jgi:TP901 family phage tail tape measure protein